MPYSLPVGRLPVGTSFFFPAGKVTYVVLEPAGVSGLVPVRAKDGMTRFIPSTQTVMMKGKAPDVVKAEGPTGEGKGGIPSRTYQRNSRWWKRRRGSARAGVHADRPGDG